MADGYRGSSPSWFGTVRASKDARAKVKTLASAISEGRQPAESSPKKEDDPHDEEPTRASTLVAARR